jgi:hypothetical protein
MKITIPAIIISFLSLSTFAQCPDLTGHFLCPKYQSQPEYKLYVSQSEIPGGVAYSHFFSFAEILDVTPANPTGKGQGIKATCKDNKMIYRQTENYIAANDNYQASVNGKVVIECKRLK